MLPTQSGSFPLFRFRGIAVSVHWSWFVIALFDLQTRRGLYHSFIWNVYEYLALFGIVLLHEFGHSLACQQVGGRADRIVLWPLGGVAFVDPPPRPGATLWSIAAGPLVNVALLPVFYGLAILANLGHLSTSAPDTYNFLRQVGLINLYLLAFNVLPIYPLDGGQILWALLWFPLGQGRSLLIATSLGFIGVAGLAWYAVLQYQRYGSIWFFVLAWFAGNNCLRGFQYARALLRRERAASHPFHDDTGS